MVTVMENWKLVWSSRTEGVFLLSYRVREDLTYGVTFIQKCKGAMPAENKDHRSHGTASMSERPWRGSWLEWCG